jgi:hypothetical protein
MSALAEKQYSADLDRLQPIDAVGEDTAGNDWKMSDSAPLFALIIFAMLGLAAIVAIRVALSLFAGAFAWLIDFIF